LYGTEIRTGQAKLAKLMRYLESWKGVDMTDLGMDRHLRSTKTESQDGDDKD